MQPMGQRPEAELQPDVGAAATVAASESNVMSSVLSSLFLFLLSCYLFAF
jgi:hypothetical protein